MRTEAIAGSCSRSESLLAERELLHDDLTAASSMTSTSRISGFCASAPGALQFTASASIALRRRRCRLRPVMLVGAGLCARSAYLRVRRTRPEPTGTAIRPAREVGGALRSPQPVLVVCPEVKFDPLSSKKGIVGNRWRWQTCSLPWHSAGNRARPTTTVLAYCEPLRGGSVCDGSPSVATALPRKCRAVMTSAPVRLGGRADSFAARYLNGAPP